MIRYFLSREHMVPRSFITCCHVGTAFVDTIPAFLRQNAELVHGFEVVVCSLLCRDQLGWKPVHLEVSLELVDGGNGSEMGTRESQKPRTA
jgi:hypothetical protein